MKLMRQRMVPLQHIVIQMLVLLVWLTIVVTILPMFWVAMNDALWRAGAGAILTDRPLAAFHNRMMGTIQEMDELGDRQSYLEGHLRSYADAPDAERSAWSAELRQIESDRQRLIIKAVVIAMLCYLPVGLVGELWLRYQSNQRLEASTAL